MATILIIVAVVIAVLIGGIKLLGKSLDRDLEGY